MPLASPSEGVSHCIGRFFVGFLFEARRPGRSAVSCFIPIDLCILLFFFGFSLVLEFHGTLHARICLSSHVSDLDLTAQSLFTSHGLFMSWSRIYTPPPACFSLLPHLLHGWIFFPQRLDLGFSFLVSGYVCSWDCESLGGVNMT